MRGCTANAVLNTAIPAVPTTNSPNDLLNRLAGQTVSKSVTLNDGAGAKFKSLFTITGLVEIKALYGVFTDVTNVVVVTPCYFDVWDGAAAVVISDNGPGTNCSAATVNSLIVVKAASSSPFTFLKADRALISQVSGGTAQFWASLINSKDATPTTVRFAVTEAAATNCAITFYCTWIARTPGSTLVAA